MQIVAKFKPDLQRKKNNQQLKSLDKLVKYTLVILDIVDEKFSYCKLKNLKNCLMKNLWSLEKLLLENDPHVAGP